MHLLSMSCHCTSCFARPVLSCRNVSSMFHIRSWHAVTVPQIGSGKIKDMFEKCVTYAAHMLSICQHLCDISIAYVFACATYVRHTCNICRNVSLFSLPYLTYAISFVKHISNICQEMRQEMHNICNKCWHKCGNTCNKCPNKGARSYF